MRNGFSGPLLLLLLLVGLAWAQPQTTFEATLSPPQCNVGDQVVLELRLSGAQNDPLEPALPDIPGLDVRNVGVAKNVSYVNGVMNSASIFSYLITPQRAGTYKIPAVRIGVDGKSFTTQPLTLQVGPTSAPGQPVPNGPGSPNTAPLFPPPIPGQGGPPNSAPLAPPAIPAQPVLVECDVSTRTPYVNQLVVYSFRFLHRVSLIGPTNYSAAGATGFLREELGEMPATTVERNGVTYSVSELRTAFFPTAPGKATIGPVHLTCQLAPDPYADPTSLFLDPQKELSTEAIELDVQPLPSQNRPPSFQGAVGRDFKLEAHLQRNEARVGESVRLQMTIEGDEHPDLLLDPQLPQWPGLKAYTWESQASPYQKPTYRASKTFKVPLVGQQPGTYHFHDLAWSYFDPQKKEYVTLTAPAVDLAITGEASASTGKEPKAAEITPLRGAQPFQGSDPVWAKSYGVALVATLPWLLSFSWMGLFAMVRVLQANYQTRSARLGRLRKQIQQTNNLEKLLPLGFEALELHYQRPLKGLPLQRLREHLGSQLVDQLGQAESLRYAPEGHEGAVLESLRLALLKELSAEKVGGE